MEKKPDRCYLRCPYKEQIRNWRTKSLAGIKNSYAPYSHFHVSAVLLCGNGAVYTGNNIETPLIPLQYAQSAAPFFKAVQ